VPGWLIEAIEAAELSADATTSSPSSS
jgi:hypothetical protein